MSQFVHTADLLSANFHSKQSRDLVDSDAIFFSSLLFKSFFLINYFLMIS